MSKDFGAYRREDYEKMFSHSVTPSSLCSAGAMLGRLPPGAVAAHLPLRRVPFPPGGCVGRRQLPATLAR